jgi:CYTH domain-containing protein
MGKEIERKFLLNNSILVEIPEHHQKFHIKQGYLLAERGRQVRIRITSDEAVIGIKFTENIIRDEFEYEIPMDEGLQIYDKLDLKLEKQRTSFNIGRYHYDIDTFPNDMKFCEVEFESIEDMNNWVKPTWLGNEITGVKKYSNIVLAEKKIKL